MRLALALFVFSISTAEVISFASAEELPPWYSYGKSGNRNNNPYDHTDRPSFPNGNAGYHGSELPEYHPDKRTREYYRDRTEPSSPRGVVEPTLDGRTPGTQRESGSWCSGEFCGR